MRPPVYCKTLSVCVPFISRISQVNKAAKLKGVNIGTVPTFIGIVCFS